MDLTRIDVLLSMVGLFCRVVVGCSSCWLGALLLLLNDLVLLVCNVDVQSRASIVRIARSDMKIVLIVVTSLKFRQVNTG